MELQRMKRYVLGLVLLTFVGVLVIGGYVVRVAGRGGADRRRRDWHDYEGMQRELLHNRSAGEFGVATLVKHMNPREHDTYLRAIVDTGFSAWLSDRIALDRALADVRHKQCSTLEYYAQLPPVSVVIVYRNEKRSLVLRSLHSVVNRTPPELLHEIILVDDCSTDEEDRQLDDDLLEYFPELAIRIVHLAEQEGLIRARLRGARVAEAEVLVFLDAHIEVMHNWLPPLLEPLVDEPRTSTTPIIDVIHYETFAYMPGSASRGAFSWDFDYVQVPLKGADLANLPRPHANPVMNGGLFAIRAAFFWELGGYDEGLQIWGAEQFELSFKIWMCGGRLLRVPCSRVGHVFPHPGYKKHYSNRTDDFVSQNYVRVAEVWMDEYKEVLYRHVPKLRKIPPGNLDAQKALRQRLQCKPFRWFVRNIIGDICEKFPPIEPPDFAYGSIKSLASPHLCLDSEQWRAAHELGSLRECFPASPKGPAKDPQQWRLTFRKDLRNHAGDCLESQPANGSVKLWLWGCHLHGGNQYWYYERSSQMLVHGDWDQDTRLCLEADLKQRKAVLNLCDFANERMKWSISHVDHEAMDAFAQTLRDRSFCSYA